MREEPALSGCSVGIALEIFRHFAGLRLLGTRQNGLVDVEQSNRTSHDGIGNESYGVETESRSLREEQPRHPASNEGNENR